MFAASEELLSSELSLDDQILALLEFAHCGASRAIVRESVPFGTSTVDSPPRVARRLEQNWTQLSSAST